MFAASAIALVLLASGCAVDNRTHRDAGLPSDWDVDPISADAASFVVDELEDSSTSSVEVPGNLSASTNDGLASTSGTQVAAIEAQSVETPVVRQRPARKKKAKKTTLEIASSACAAPFRGEDETVTLATTSDLKLRQGPSTKAATISVYSEGMLLTARKLSCGNWTEIVEGKRTIGYVHSYFLTSP